MMSAFASNGLWPRGEDDVLFSLGSDGQSPEEPLWFGRLPFLRM